ncbi:unnamed protein product [Linum trigynum]|uniref:UBA domain-containing protein n=1 Tax=Linum trigynum TaxID=586398 RepID=A0AAV2CND4_9ROSI
MNTSQYMDKQIMDLTSSPQPQGLSSSPTHHSTGGGKDFIDLMNHHSRDDEHDQHANYAGNGTKKEDVMVPSYDFHPIRPVAGGLGGGGGDSTAGARAWSSVDGKSSSVNFAMADSPVRHYGSLDSMEPSKDVLDKEQTVSDSAILSEIDRTMKRHTDNMLIILEGVSSRLVQLESRTRNLESSVDDLKVSVGNNHGSTDGKMRQLENILREVQTGVRDVKDKQELLESQLHLQKLHVSNVNQHQQEPQNTDQAATAVQQQAPSASAPAPPQSHHQHAPPQLASFPQSLPSVPGPPPPTVPLPQPQSLPPVTPLPNQFTPPPSVPQRDPYYVPAGHAHEPPPNPQYQVPPPQQPSPVAAAPPPHQLYQSALPQYPQQQPQMPQQPQQPAGHHSDEASYLASQSYPPRQAPSQLLGGGPFPPQQYYGIPPSTGYNPPQSGSMEMYPYSGGGITMVKPQQLQSVSMPPHGGGGTGYPQLPTARVLPQGLPSRSVAGGAGSGSGSGNTVPIDDVIDKVSTMGFPRDHVREAVRKLTENGQSVDLNIVLDKLMNDSDFQPPRGWFGR